MLDNRSLFNKVSSPVLGRSLLTAALGLLPISPESRIAGMGVVAEVKPRIRGVYEVRTKTHSKLTRVLGITEGFLDPSDGNGLTPGGGLPQVLILGGVFAVDIVALPMKGLIRALKRPTITKEFSLEIQIRLVAGPEKSPLANVILPIEAAGWSWRLLTDGDGRCAFTQGVTQRNLSNPNGFIVSLALDRLEPGPGTGSLDRLPKIDPVVKILDLGILPIPTVPSK